MTAARMPGAGRTAHASAGDAVTRIDAALDVAPPGRGPVDDTFFPPDERECRVCGCTDEDATECVEATGGPCSWVVDDLCSRCADPAPETAPAMPPPGRPTPPPAAAQTPPAAWVATVLALQAADGLAPFTTPPGEAPLVDGRWRLYPWRLRRDITALVEWMQHLQAPRSVWRLHRPGPAVAVHGLLAGQPVALIADSHRIPPTVLTEALLRELAAEEQRREEEWATYRPLSLAEQADPLQVLQAPAGPSPRPRTPVAAGQGAS